MKQNNRAIERFRITQGRMATTSAHGNNGAFKVSSPWGKLFCIVSDGTSKIPGLQVNWEHVSVSTHKQDKVPTWEMMCFIKSLFWEEEEVVVQYHPAKSQYVNFHPTVLHLWKPVDQDLPTPTWYLVGPKPHNDQQTANAQTTS